MKTTRSIFMVLFFAMSLSARAGDAVAIGYNADGVWTAVTYNRSSTPKGGAHYRRAAQARVAAVHDLYVRAGDDVARTSVISETDFTGYVAVARGTTQSGKDVTIVSHRKSQGEADQRALRALTSAGATVNQTVVYRYFSFGEGSAGSAK